MAVAVQTEERLTLVQAEAIAAIERAGGDRKAAAGILQGEAKKSTALMAALMERDLASRCWEAIRSAERLLKPNTLSAMAIWTEPNSKEASEIRLREADRLSSLYFWTLPSGKPLGSATKEDVREAIEHFRHLENGNRIQRIWLESIQSRLKGGQTVEKALSEKKLAQLREEADSKAGVD